MSCMARCRVSLELAKGSRHSARNTQAAALDIMVIIHASTAVFVRGFDFGTTQDQLEGHCSQVGTVASVDMGKGSAVVTFASAAEANAAVANLNKSTIDGNTRFIDVSIDKKSLPPRAGVKRSAGDSSGSTVFVRGFDFGTTDEQLEAHMSSVGTPENVKWVTKGSAEVTYSSVDEAAAAVEQLAKTTIEGNSRFIDVSHAKEDGQHSAKRFNAGGAVKGGGGKGQWVFMPAIPNSTFGGGKSFGKGSGGGKAKGKGRGGDHKDEDPAGSGRVFVRGFDFGTDDAQFEGHMSTAGPIHQVHWVTKGSAVVVYKKKASAAKAASQLNQTTIEGNSRYMDVILKD